MGFQKEKKGGFEKTTVGSTLQNLVESLPREEHFDPLDQGIQEWQANQGGLVEGLLLELLTIYLN